MRTVLRSPLVAALIGGAVVAVALLVLDVGGGGTTTTVVQQAPVASPSSERAQRRAAAEQGLTAHDIYERDAPGVVHVRSELRSSAVSSPFGTDQGGEATGTGFVIDADGHILTNYHVVADATSVSVGFDDNRVVQARVLGTDATNDLALLQVEHRRPQARAAAARRLAAPRRSATRCSRSATRSGSTARSRPASSPRSSARSRRRTASRSST